MEQEQSKTTILNNKWNYFRKSYKKYFFGFDSNETTQKKRKTENMENYSP